MSTSKVTVCVQGGTPVWDSFDDWVALVESVGGHVMLFGYADDDDSYWVRAQKTTWTDDEILAAINEIADDEDVSPAEIVTKDGIG